MLTVIKLERILFLRIKYKVPLHHLMATKSNEKDLFLKLNRIIDRFLETYPDYDNETITVRSHDINWALNYPKPFRSLFMIFEYFLNKLSKPLLIIDHLLDTTYWNLAEMCRHLDDRSVLVDVIDKAARNLKCLSDRDLNFLKTIMEFLTSFNSKNKDFIKQLAILLTPYLFTGKYQLYKIERHFYPLTILFICCWTDINLGMKNLSKAPNKRLVTPVNHYEKFYNPLAGKMVKNSWSQTAHALVEPKEYYEADNSVFYQMALNSLENKFQNLSTSQVQTKVETTINKDFYKLTDITTDFWSYHESSSGHTTTSTMPSHQKTLSCEIIPSTDTSAILGKSRSRSVNDICT